MNENNNNQLNNATNIMLSVSTFIKELQKYTLKVLPSIEKITEDFVKTLKAFNENTKIFEVFETIKAASIDPESFLNWVDYCLKLSEFFWIIPFDITSKELYDILEVVDNEKDFDKRISKYFTKAKVIGLITEIKKNLNPKYQNKFFEQLVKAYDNKLYAIASVGVINIIDGLLSFYIKDKGCNARCNLFLPIIKEKETENVGNLSFLYLLLLMVNSNINTLYENIEFNETIKINTHKVIRRNPIAHGKKYSYSKIDCIMLLNTLYYLTYLQLSMPNYKNLLKYNSKQKNFQLLNKNII